MALKQIKNKIVTTQKTGKVTKAMEAVSAVKMRKSQQRALAGKPYAEAAVRILHHISKSQDSARFLAEQKHGGAECLVVITSDKGLAGSLNSAVLKEATLALTGKDKKNVRVIPFGRKAHEFFLRNGYTVDKHYTNVSDAVSLGDMHEVVSFITKAFQDGTYGKISVAYQSFVSTFEQKAVLRQVLPLDPDQLLEMVRDIVPKKGLHSDEVTKEQSDHVYTVEPSAEEVAEVLISQLVQIMLYHALLENKASEHSARMVAMKNATDKTKELTKMLTIKFNKERQAVITAEVSEITGGIEAMKE